MYTREKNIDIVSYPLLSKDMVIQKSKDRADLVWMANNFAETLCIYSVHICVYVSCTLFSTCSCHSLIKEHRIPSASHQTPPRLPQVHPDLPFANRSTKIFLNPSIAQGRISLTCICLPCPRLILMSLSNPNSHRNPTLTTSHTNMHTDRGMMGKLL
jgi:hypothetical protein